MISGSAAVCDAKTLIFNGIVSKEPPSACSCGTGRRRGSVSPAGTAPGTCAGGRSFAKAPTRSITRGPAEADQDPGGSAGSVLALLEGFDGVPALLAQPDAAHGGALCAGFGLGLGMLSIAASAFFCAGVRIPA